MTDHGRRGGTMTRGHDPAVPLVPADPADAGRLERGLAQLRGAEDELASGVVRGLAALDWYPALDPRLRSWIVVLVQHQVRVFCDQLGRGEMAAAQLDFLSARPAGGAGLSLEQSTQLVRRGCTVLVDLCEQIVDRDLAPIVRSTAEAFLRETAFDVAQIYARAAERRGATDARRQESLMSALIEGLPETVLAGRAAGLLGHGGPFRAFGMVPEESVTPLLTDVQWQARRRELPLVATVHGGWVLGVAPDDLTALAALLPPGAVRLLVVGEPAESVPQLGPSMAEVLAGVQVSAAYRGPGPLVTAEDLIPERALCGDARAREALAARCVQPLLDAGGDLLETVEALLAADGVLGSVARALPAHVNTVRYRLGRVQALTGRDPRRLRDALEFQLAIAHHRVTTDGGTTTRRRG